MLRLYSRQRRGTRCSGQKNYASGITLRSTSEVKRHHSFKRGNVTLVSRTRFRNTKKLKLEENRWNSVLRTLAKKSVRIFDTRQRRLLRQRRVIRTDLEIVHTDQVVENIGAAETEIRRQAEAQAAVTVALLNRTASQGNLQMDLVEVLVDVLEVGP